LTERAPYQELSSSKLPIEEKNENFGSVRIIENKLENQDKIGFK